MINFIITFLLSISFTYSVYGQIKTASPSSTLVTPTKMTEEKEIQAIKEKSVKVVELHQKNNKAISGFVQTVSDKEMKIKTKDETDCDVKIDPDLTKFYQIINNQKKEIKRDNVKKGSYIIVTGIVNDKTINANFIYLDEVYIVDSGKVSEVNKQEYFIKAATTDKNEYTLDIETYTSQQILDIKTLKLERGGFSKMKEGDTLHFVIKKTSAPAGGEKENNRFAAQKILIIPQEYFLK